MASFKPTIELVSEDTRGEIYVINLPGDRELLLLHSNAGTWRGGHSHDVPESVLVLKGELQYQKLSVGGEPRIENLTDGSHSHNFAGEPHLGYFPVDSWILEWKICKDKRSWTNTNYEPWRKQVTANAV